MKLVIPNALPPITAAHALADPFASRYPKLVHLFNAKAFNAQSFTPQANGCTPAEGIKLESLGYQAPVNTPIGAALGALHARVTDTDQPVWVAELCATMISQERATVLPLSLIQASADDVAMLEQSARPLFEAHGDGIEIEPLGMGLWRVHAHPPAPAFPGPGRTISPLALMGQDLGDWWPVGDAWRSWRKRVNEIQMEWHDHPVNERRQKQGLPPINGVWLYGGAHGFTPLLNDTYHWLESLSEPAWQGDWSGWLDAWQVLQPTLEQAAPNDEIVLTGEDRIVRLNNAPNRWWQNLFARGQQDTWRSWWLNQN